MASTGTLTTRIYTSRAQIPVPGATLAVTQMGPNGRHTLLAVRVADESGRTAPIEIQTPDTSAGLSPGGVTPFALVDLWIDAAGFELMRVNDVQVFPGSITVQNVDLIPLVEHGSPATRTEAVQVTPQNL